MFRYADRFIKRRQAEYAKADKQLTTLQKTGAVSGEEIERAEIATPSKEIPMAEEPKQKLSEQAILEMSDEELGHLVDDSYEPDRAEEVGKAIKAALYASSMVGFLLAHNMIIKAVTSSVSSICAVILYQEVVYGDRQWTEWSYWLIVVVSLNYFLFYSLIEKYKNRIRHE